MTNDTIVHVTNHDDGTKMEGIQSISTNCIDNPICLAHMQGKDGCICKKCYAQRLSFRRALQADLTENGNLLTTHELTTAEITQIPLYTLLVRFQSFGEVANVLEAKNYIRIMQHFAEQHFSVFSKNPHIWKKAFEELGKPENCTYVHSSMMINETDYEAAERYPFIDRVFTVFKGKLPEDQMHCQRHCVKCQMCYRRYEGQGVIYIAEIFR